MKLTYTKPEIIIDELAREDVLLVSIEARKNGIDNTDFGVQALFRAIGDDLFDS